MGFPPSESPSTFCRGCFLLYHGGSSLRVCRKWAVWAGPTAWPSVLGVLLGFCSLPCPFYTKKTMEEVRRGHC